MINLNTYKHINNQQSSYNNPNFNGVTEELGKKFTKTQQEVIAEFLKDPKSNWIAGDLPTSWKNKLIDKNEEEISKIIKDVFMLFRSAIKHLKPYNAKKGTLEYNQNRANLESSRLKEVSRFLTKGLRHFGILSDTNSVNLKKLKVTGKYINRGYVLKEKGINPSLERLFIKKFKKINPLSIESNTNGQYSEIAHGIYLNKNIKNEHIARFYWGDTKVGYMVTKYETPPKHISPIVKFKTSYKNETEFANDLLNQTGIKLEDVKSSGTPIGEYKNGEFYPAPKEITILGYLQTIFKDKGLYHYDLHNLNALIGTTKDNKPIVKITDIGGIAKI